jgi:hypothetical protein
MADSLVGLDLFDDVVDHPELGVVEVHQAYGIIPSTNDSVKGYRMIEELQLLVDQIPGDVDITGHIRGRGELGDHTRYYVAGNRRVVEEKAKILWPDGTTEDAR